MVNVVLNVSISEPLGFQAYCLNPPDDNCRFGPCPNTDVTGFGQQISLYISATVFTLTLVHMPKQLRFAWYGYVVNVLSFLASALISIGGKSMTRDDAIFVLVAMASPASLYLWFLFPLTIFYLLRAKHLPKYLVRLGKYERIFFLITSAVTFIGWIAVFCLTFEPRMAERLSQKACNKNYRKSTVLLLMLWSPIFFTQCLIVFLIVLLTLGLQRLFIQGERTLVHRRTSTSPPAVVTLTTWTFQSLRRYHTDMGFAYWSRPVLIAILVPICNTLLDVGQASPLGSKYFEVAIILVFILHLLWSMLRKRLWSWFAIFLILLSSLLAAVPLFLYKSLTMSLSTIILPLLGFTALTDAGQVTKSSTLGYRIKIYWPMVFIFSASLLTRNNIWWPFDDLLSDNPFAVALTVTLVAFAVSFKYVTWVLLWQTTSFRPSLRARDDLDTLWHGIIDHSAIFKFVNLVLIPTILWIFSTVESTKASHARGDAIELFEFGQVYSLVTAALAVLAVLSELVFKWGKFKQVLLRGYHDVVTDPDSTDPDMVQSPVEEKRQPNFLLQGSDTSAQEELGSADDLTYTKSQR